MLFNFGWPSFIKAKQVDGINFLSPIHTVIDAGASLVEFNVNLLQTRSLEVIGALKIFQVPNSSIMNCNIQKYAPKLMYALWYALIGQMSYVRVHRISVNWNPIECLLRFVLTYETPNG